MPELTPEAKEAIRNYMLKFAVPSAVLLTTVAGALGYTVSGLARIDAVSEAAKYALTAAGAAAEAKATALSGAADVARAVEQARASAENARATSASITLVKSQVDSLIAGKYDEFAHTLFAIKEFRDSVATIPQVEIGEFNSRIGAIEKAVFAAETPTIPGPGNTCPAGTYVVGVGSVGVPGGAHGYLESVSVTCRPLRFSRP